MTKTVLIMTCGQTDVQLVDVNTRRDFSKRNVGEVHDQLETNPTLWTIVDAPLERSAEVQGLPVTTPWTLCTSKFDAVMNHLGDAAPERLLLLETTRTRKTADPRFAGGVLARRAHQKGVSEVLRRPYLGPDDNDLEDRQHPEDAIVRRDVVARLESAIKESLVGTTRVVVAATGGMPEIKALVRELARLYVPAGAILENIEVDDGAPKGLADRVVIRKSFDPVESVHARRRALSLIEKGNFLGAWAVAKEIHEEREDQRKWTDVVKWLALFASSMPIPEQCDLPALTHRRMAVKAALRAELALRSEDIPRAVHGTVAFFEAAMWDHLNERVSRHSTKRQYKFYVAPSEDLVQEREPDKLASSSKTQQRKNRDKPFSLKETTDGCDWYEIDDSNICAIQIAKHYLQLGELTKLGQTVSNDVRELRNDVAHNEPTPQLMQEAQKRLQAAALWSENKGILSQPLIQNVLTELGEPQPELLWDSLLNSVRTRLLSI